MTDAVCVLTGSVYLHLQKYCAIADDVPAGSYSQRVRIGAVRNITQYLTISLHVCAHSMYVFASSEILCRRWWCPCGFMLTESVYLHLQKYYVVADDVLACSCFQDVCMRMFRNIAPLTMSLRGRAHSWCVCVHSEILRHWRCPCGLCSQWVRIYTFENIMLLLKVFLRVLVHRVCVSACSEILSCRWWHPCAFVLTGSVYLPPQKYYAIADDVPVGSYSQSVRIFTFGNIVTSLTTCLCVRAHRLYVFACSEILCRHWRCPCGFGLTESAYRCGLKYYAMPDDFPARLCS